MFSSFFGRSLWHDFLFLCRRCTSGDTLVRVNVSDLTIGLWSSCWLMTSSPLAWLWDEDLVLHVHCDFLVVYHQSERVDLPGWCREWAIL